MDWLALSTELEAMLVERNLRGMQRLRENMAPGYVFRGAQLLAQHRGQVLIGTGFPVTDTFETDGPVGAIALYQALERFGDEPIIACGDPLYSAIKDDYRCLKLEVNQLARAREQTQRQLAELHPNLIVSIERPGLSEQGRYTNMRGEDISERCACFDYFIIDAPCPTLAIGDGGNEIGMGNQLDTLKALDIIPCATRVDELVVADVSNWAPFGLLAMLELLTDTELLRHIDSRRILHYLSAKGSVDGVTRENTITEDSLCVSEGEDLLRRIQQRIQQARQNKLS